MISIIIPAYNEAHRILPSLRMLTHFCDTHFNSYEILVVDDGSTDDTVETVGRVDHGHVHIHRLPRNRGKGAAVAYGMDRARGRWRFFTDADLPYDLNVFLEAVASFQTQVCDIITGARDMAPAPSARAAPSYAGQMPPVSGQNRNNLRRIAGEVFSHLVRHLVSIEVRDTQCGFKGFTAPAAVKLFPRLKTAGYAFDVEIFCLARSMSMRICRVPVTLMKTKGSKIRLNRDPFLMFIDLIRISRRTARGAFKESRHQ